MVLSIVCLSDLPKPTANSLLLILNGYYSCPFANVVATHATILAESLYRPGDEICETIDFEEVVHKKVGGAELGKT